MALASKNKGFFVDQNEYSILLARTSRSGAPLVVEELKECLVGDAMALTAAITDIQQKKSSSNFCARRVVSIRAGVS
jgi:hypothetical protein